MRRASNSRTTKKIEKICQELGFKNIEKIIVSENAPFSRWHNFLTGWEMYFAGMIEDQADLGTLDEAGYKIVWRKVATLGGCGKYYVQS